MIIYFYARTVLKLSNFLELLSTKLLNHAIRIIKKKFEDITKDKP